MERLQFLKRYNINRQGPATGRDMMLPELQENRRSKAQVMADRAAMAEFMRKKNAMAGARKADAAELKNLKAKMIKGQPHSLAYMTEQEMEAMNQLKSEPGLRGRLARRVLGKDKFCGRSPSVL